MPTNRVCPLAELTVEKIEEDIHPALQGWDEQKPGSDSIRYLRLFHDLIRQKGCTGREANKIIFEQGVNELRWRSEDDAAKAQLLEEKYKDGMTQVELCSIYHIEQAGFFRRLQKARRRLAEVIYQLEHKARSKHRDRQFRRLETPTYELLIGASTVQQNLRDYLLTDGAPFLIALEGIGGIGKSAQLDHFLREIIHEDLWDEIVWISAKQEKLTNTGRLRELGQPPLTTETLIERLFKHFFPESQKGESFSSQMALVMLEERLRQSPCCLCLDNIETAPDIDALLPTLERLANPSKIILTTREEIEEDDLSITHIELPELTKSDALLLMRETASTKHLLHVSSMNDEDLERVYNVVGGHPLALCLLIGQIEKFGLNQALEDIQEASGVSNENLFTYIYLRAWKHLTEEARIVLSVMPLLRPQGGEYALLTHITQLSRGDLRKALDELIALSLVQTRGHGTEMLFSIHGLTRTFLREEVQQSVADLATEESALDGFESYVVRAIDFACTEIEQTGPILHQTEQEQALHILGYGLDLAPQNSDVWPPTRHLLLELVPRLERAGFHSEWASYVKQGIAASKANRDPLHEAFLQLHLGRLYQITGNYKAAHDVLALSTDYFEEIDDVEHLATSLAQRAYMYALQRRHKEARPLLQRAIERLSVTDPQQEYVYYIEGLLALNDNDGVTAEQWFKKSLDLCEDLGDKRLIAKRLGNLGTALYMQQKYEQALAYYNRALALLAELQDEVQAAIMQIGGGIVGLERAQPHQALAAFEQAEPSLRKGHEVLHLAVLDVNVGMAFHQLGKWQEAEERFLRAIARYQQLRDFHRAANAMYEYALVLCKQKFIERAQQALAGALDSLVQSEPGPGRDALQATITEQIGQLS
ncbi:tetratricopeptide repeat protein [Chloroflexi bacterium TSY]|nr:tetratricopeptide repeat protein [Chloroflexi bacterium TSY]